MSVLFDDSESMKDLKERLQDGEAVLLHPDNVLISRVKVSSHYPVHTIIAVNLGGRVFTMRFIGKGDVKTPSEDEDKA